MATVPRTPCAWPQQQKVPAHEHIAIFFALDSLLCLALWSKLHRSVVKLKAACLCLCHFWQYEKGRMLNTVGILIYCMLVLHTSLMTMS
jgi:hypothetical protein